jgi:hypothetical protein
MDLTLYTRACFARGSATKQTVNDKQSWYSMIIMHIRTAIAAGSFLAASLLSCIGSSLHLETFYMYIIYSLFEDGCCVYVVEMTYILFSIFDVIIFQNKEVD